MSPRRLATGFIGSALFGGPLLAGLVWAGPAQADAAGFLNDMHRDGVHAVTGGDAALLQAGLNVCQQISWGAPPAQLEGLALQRSDDQQGSGGLSAQQANDVVVYAMRDLCPS
ncbi:hypothetical protein A5646_11030 [Mycobacterium sp. 1245499.0]|uniref:DUF732 domain-containing protein n=1 Tax=unclassified Mycobacterium TaxID=2642494 RepID=UPI0007FF9CAC|nr:MULTISPECIES: DUF732 domain-containing protein [unclassified Mycobacterium]OBJ10113.1 hypothetical protein A5624_16295 [Mycobacterium sp. 1482292.6]OBL09966.1 hypothetical protein A5646_11030 [Mycobacterium sp. 1245499.0]